MKITYTSSSAVSTRSAGFSLLALLLYITLTSILLSALASLTIAVLANAARTRAVNELAYADTFVRGYLPYATKEVQEVVLPVIGSTSTELLIRHPSGELGRIYVDGGRLWTTEGISAPRALSVSNVSFDEFVVARVERDGGIPYLRVTGRISTPDPRGALNTPLSDTLTITWYPYNYAD
jgi:hypothetical protein